MNGHYEEEYFAHDKNQIFLVELNITVRRLRAVIQYKNAKFLNLLRIRDYKYYIGERKEANIDGEVTDKVKIDSEAVKIDVSSLTLIIESILTY